MSASSPREVVLRFLSSMGRPADAAQYLSLFRHEAERFAMIHVSEQVISDALDGLLVNLRFLAELSLHPAVVVGATSPGSAAHHAELLTAALATTTGARIVAPVEIAATLQQGTIPVVDLSAGVSEDERFDALARLVVGLQTNKLVFLGRRSGLQPRDGQVLSIVDVATDLAPVVNSLAGAQGKLLHQCARIFAQVAHPFTIAVTSPLDLLRELFTVRGAGTLVRRGSRVHRHHDWSTVDGDKLTALIVEAFARPLTADLRQHTLRTIYVADDYRGAAVITDTAVAPYLSKFAVTTIARGEGVGGDLWRALTGDFPRLFWRSRADNPVAPWYREQCDGMQRILIDAVPWLAFWRGLDGAEITAAITYCQRQPQDLASSPP
jgi:acetylglutamate kinase